MFRFESARPGAVGKRNLGGGSGVNENPWLAYSARWDVRFGGVEMPACANFVIVVAGAARVACRKRQKHIIVGKNLIVLLITNVD